MPEFKESFDAVVKQIKEDPSYRRSWENTLSVCIRDALSEQFRQAVDAAAAKAATNFTELLIDLFQKGDSQQNQEPQPSIAIKKKYEFTGETMQYEGHTLRRIRRLSDGLVGGWIEKEENLSHEDKCFVYDDAKVYGNARVFDNAWVYGEALVYGNVLVCGEASVYGDAEVYGNARVFGEAWVYGYALVCGEAKVYDEAEVYGNAVVSGNAKVSGNARVCGEAKVYDEAEVYGEAQVYGEARIGDSTKVYIGCRQ